MKVETTLNKVRKTNENGARIEEEDKNWESGEMKRRIDSGKTQEDRQKRDKV